MSSRWPISQTSSPRSSTAIQIARSTTCCRGPTTQTANSKPWPENIAYNKDTDDKKECEGCISIDNSQPIDELKNKKPIADDDDKLAGYKVMQTKKGAMQFIFDNGLILRFDLKPGQYLPGQGPHINVENQDINSNVHIPVKP